MKTIYLTIISLFALTATAATRTAVTNGNWNNGSTWGGTSNIPASGDSVVIPNGITVTVASTIDMTSGSRTVVNILAGGTLDMNNGRRLRMASNSYVNLATSAARVTHGGGGNNTHIEVGGVIVWSADNGSLTGPQVVPASALPVLLTSFQAKAVKVGIVSIEWVTAAEINNHYFDIERSTDLENFEKIDRVNGTGNTYNSTTYQTIDYDAPEGIVYYRLVQVDFDGTTTIYPPVAVTQNETRMQTGIYPNPTNGVLNLELNGNQTATSVMVNISDLNGKTVYTQNMYILPGVKWINVLNGSENLKAGFYTLTIENGNNREQLKVQITN